MMLLRSAHVASTKAAPWNFEMWLQREFWGGTSFWVLRTQKAYREKRQNGDTHALDACCFCFASIISFCAVTNTSQFGLGVPFPTCTKTFIQAHGETLGFEVLCHWFAPQMSCIQGKTTNFIQFSIVCNANESRGWSPDFIVFRTFASVSVPGGVQTTNQPNQLMVIAFRLRLQQTEDLFIAGGVRFRLQLRCASLGGGGSAAALRLQLGAQVRGKKKRRVGISLGGSDFNFGFSFEQPNSAGGGWFSDALRLRVGPKAGGAVRVGFLCAWGSGQILTSVSASKRKPRAGSLAFWLWLTSQGVGVKGWMGVRLHFDVDFDFPPDVFGKQPTKLLQCTSTSVSTWRGVRVKTLDC